MLITNTHFDYLDLASVRLLNERFGKNLIWLVPMGVAEWMNKAGCANVVELEWWDEEDIEIVDQGAIEFDEPPKVRGDP